MSATDTSRAPRLRLLRRQQDRPAVVHFGQSRLLLLRPLGLDSRHRQPCRRYIAWWADYFPWGEVSQISENVLSNEYRFGGQEYDYEVEHYYFPFRHYSPQRGTFMTTDPYDGSMDLSSPQSLGRYAYVGDDPGNWMDPLGLVPCRPGAPNYENDCEPPEPPPTDLPEGGVPGSLCEFGFCHRPPVPFNPNRDPNGPPQKPQSNGPTPTPPSQCTTAILDAVNGQFGTNFTSDNVQRTFNNGPTQNLNIGGTGLPTAQFNSIQTGRYPLNPITWLTGFGSTLHVTGTSLLNPPPATFQNSNIGGLTSVTFTAHIDSAFAYNPLGALIHLLRDVLHIGGKHSPC